MSPLRRHREYALVLGYFTACAAGVSALIGQWQGAIGDFLGYSAIVWAILLGLGGALSGYSAITTKWMGESLGIPVMFSALGLLGAVLLVASAGSSTRISLGLLLISFACFLYSRWNVVRKEEEFRRSMAPRGEGPDG